MATIKRKIDNLGRMVITSDIRDLLGIKHNDTLLVTTDGESVIIKPQAKICHLCGKALLPDEKSICKRCIEEIVK